MTNGTKIKLTSIDGGRQEPLLYRCSECLNLFESPTIAVMVRTFDDGEWKDERLCLCRSCARPVDREE